MSFKNNNFKSIDSCQNSTLAFYQRQIRNQQKVLVRVQKVLPTQLADKISQCVISKKKLILYIESIEWLAQLMIYQPQILQSITDLIVLEKIEMRIVCDVIETETNAKVKREVKRPSAQTINEIRQNAQSGKEDILSQSLLRLSQTLGRLS
jgi:hypothetical protein